MTNSVIANRIKKAGTNAELAVTTALRSGIKHRCFAVLSDIMLPSSGNTTHVQIDHYIICSAGTFCVETKADHGSIHGMQDGERKAIDLLTGRSYMRRTTGKWSKNDKFKVTPIKNPLRQNYSHTQSLLMLKGMSDIRKCLTPIVCYPNADNVHYYGEEKVFAGVNNLIRYINELSGDILSDEQVMQVTLTVKRANITDPTVRASHLRQVNILNDRVKSRTRRAGQLRVCAMHY